MPDRLRRGSVISADGTTIGFVSLGDGPGLLLVGGALSTASTYLPLAEALTEGLTVHVMDRRGRPSSGPQRPGHTIEDECADVSAVAQATGARIAFGHSFGGLVLLEDAARVPAFDQIVVYEPGVSIAGSLSPGWLDRYARLLERGDRRGAFAAMVQHAGFAPRALAVMPLWYVKAVLRLVIRGARWTSIDRLLEANLGEHRIVAALDAPDAARFSMLTATVHLLAGGNSPDAIGRPNLERIAAAIPDSDVRTLPGVGHLAPEEEPARLAAAIRAVIQPSRVRSGDSPKTAR